MMDLFIVEPSLDGHHGVYVEQIIRRALEVNSLRPTLITAIEANLVEVERLQIAIGSRLNVVDCKTTAGMQLFGGILSNILRELSYWAYFKKCLRLIATAESNIIFVPFLDAAINAIGLLGSPFKTTKFCGICMRQRFHFEVMGVFAPYSRQRKLEKFLFDRFLKTPTLSFAATIDETLKGFYDINYPHLTAKLTNIGDPISEPALNSCSNGSESDKYKTILVYGALDVRKGIKDLCEALVSNAKALPFRLKIVFAGRQSKDVENYIEGLRGISESFDIEVINRRITDELEAFLFDSCDMVWLGYRGHYTMSGVMVKAAMAQKPLLATNEGLIGYHAKRMPNAFVFNINDPLDIYIKIESAGTSKIVPSDYFDSYTWTSAFEKLFPQ